MKNIRCEYCDNLIKLDNLRPGYEYHCSQCDSLIYRSSESMITIVSMVFSTFIIFFAAVSMPLLNVRIIGENEISIIQSIFLLFQSDVLSGVILVVTIIVIPLILLPLILIILFQKHLNISKKNLIFFISFYQTIKEWNMIHIYFVGLLVSMVKITDISNMTILSGLWINGLFVLMFYITVTLFNPYDTLHIHRKKKRIKNSLNKTIFFLVLAFIFIIPANILPIMPIYKYSVYFPNTLIDGVISFYEEGDYFVSFVILISSIILPIVKLLGILFMLVMVKYNLFNNYKKAVTKYYIFINKISKFSMIDVYVVVLASSFIQYDDLIRIEIGEAFIPFTLVVFFTVIANKSFDTRLIWKNNR